MLKSARNVSKTSFIRNTAKLSLGNTITLLSSFLATPVLSRLFSPKDYGEWGVFSSILAILNSFLLLSYENAIVKSSDDKEETSIIILCIIIGTLISIIVWGVFSLGSYLGISYFVNFSSITLLISALFISMFRTICRFLANRHAMYNDLTLANITMGVSQVSSRVLLGFANIRLGLIIGNILGAFSSFAYLLYKLKNQSFRYSHISIQSIFSLVVKYKRFPLYDAPAQIIALTIVNIVFIVLSFYYKKEEIGQFSIIYNLVMIPMALFGTSLSTVYYKELSKEQDKEHSIKFLTLRTAKVSIYISCIPCLFFALGGDRLLLIFLGEQWRLASQMAVCLSILSVPYVISETLLPLFRIMDKQNVYFILNIITLLLTLLGIMLGAFLNLNILKTLILFSICVGISRFLMIKYQIKIANLLFLQFRKEFLCVFGGYILLAIRLL